MLLPNPETNYFNKKTSSNQSLIKRLEPQFVGSSTKVAWYWQLTPEQLADQLWYKRTARKFITLLQTFTVVVQVLRRIHNLWIFSSLLILNYKDWTVADRLGSAHLLFQLPKCYISIRAIWEPTSSSEAMMFSALTCAWSAPKESTYILTQLFILAIRHNGFRLTSSYDYFRK